MILANIYRFTIDLTSVILKRDMENPSSSPFSRNLGFYDALPTFVLVLILLNVQILFYIEVKNKN